MTGSIQQKEGDEELPMPWPSFVYYWPIMSSMKPRQKPQGLALKLLIQDMQTVLVYALSRYPLPICSDGSGSLQSLFSGCQKMGKNTYCKQYLLYPSALATTSVAFVIILKSISCLVRSLIIWDTGIRECVLEVP